MKKALFIDTATERGLISFYEEQQVIYCAHLPIGLNNSAYLLPAIHQALNRLQLTIQELSYIGIGVGPGSYTGMRVGAMVAKTLSFACHIPMISLNTLSGFICSESDQFAVMVDAKVSGVYCLKQRGAEPQIVPLEHVKGYLGNIHRLVTPKLMPLKQKLDVLYPDNRWQWTESGLCANQIGELLWERYQNGAVCTDNNIELLYLRDTQAEEERRHLKNTQG